MATKIKLEDVFATIDLKDADGFAAYLTDDGVFRFGSQESVRGCLPSRGRQDQRLARLHRSGAGRHRWSPWP